LDGRSAHRKAATYHRTTQTQNKLTQTSMPPVGFEHTIPVFERAKTVHASDHAATVIDCIIRIQNKFTQILYSGSLLKLMLQKNLEEFLDWTLILGTENSRRMHCHIKAKKKILGPNSYCKLQIHCSACLHDKGTFFFNSKHCCSLSNTISLCINMSLFIFNFINDAIAGIA
jgi:hypothetical protein